MFYKNYYDMKPSGYMNNHPSKIYNYLTINIWYGSLYISTFRALSYNNLYKTFLAVLKASKTFVFFLRM